LNSRFGFAKNNDQSLRLTHGSAARVGLSQKKMPSIKVTKNRTTNKKVDRINEILRSETLLGNVEHDMKHQLQQKLLGKTASAAELQGGQDFAHTHDLQEHRHLFGGFETLS